MLFKRCTHTEWCFCPWWYAFELNGRRYRKSTKTANKQTAGRVAERRRIAVLEGKDDATPQIMLKQHIEEYLAYTAQKNRTAYKDRAVLSRFLDSVGDRECAGVSPFHVERWKTGRVADVSRSTVNRELNIVRGCFARAVEWDRLQKSPLAAVKAFKVDDARVRVLSDDELRQLFTSVDEFTQTVCRVTLECLPRLSEVLGLHREHIGPSWIELRRKGGSVDRAPITSELRATLLGRVHARSGYVFGEGSKGNPPSEQLASLRVVRELRRLGISNASHHTMRHTGVTLMLEAGVNPRAIQRLAGWSSLRMLERYGHARDTEIRRAVMSNAGFLKNVLRASTEP